MYTLKQLEAQTYQQFHLYLVVNNPDLVPLVRAAVAQVELTVDVLDMGYNYGPYGRILTMHRLAGVYDWFMTLDDDMTIGRNVLEKWSNRRSGTALQGFRGWLFQGGYWKRKVAPYDTPCHYLWGGNQLIPKQIVQRPDVLDLDERYWQCDDLWLSYYANHVLGVPLLARRMEVKLDADGKDTYVTQKPIKQALFSKLIAQGWQLA